MESIAGQLKRYVRRRLDGDDAADFFYRPARGVRPVSGKQPADPRMDALAGEAAHCTKCALHKSRQRVVFGEGDPRARLVLVGEAPGAEEDRQGRPFVGAAGQLLTRMLEAIGLRREKVYICNVLKCRPPGNRNPQPEEISACRDWLQQQLELLKPEVICTLGTYATQTLLDTQEPIGKMRGKVHRFQGVALVPTFHPAALLYHPQNKRLAWEDMKQIASLLGLKPVQAGKS
ncbi:MAG: uracil-DNA glycosylase [candidate division FCPU426 bacterium]